MSLAELDEVKDGEESDDREEVNLHSSRVSTSISASDSLSSSVAGTAGMVGVAVVVGRGSGTAGGSGTCFLFLGWVGLFRSSLLRETAVAHGGLLTIFGWAGGARATLGATAFSKLL